MVTFRKKIALIISLLVFSRVTLGIEEYYSGQIHIKEIFLNSQTGMSLPKHVNPDPAETYSLLNDLCYRQLIKAIPCDTYVGSLYIEEMIKAPYRAKDKDAVLTKQNFIKKLVENPALKSKFDELLAQARQSERDTMIFFSETFKHERCPELAQLDLLQKEESYQYPFKKWMNTDNFGRIASMPGSLSMTYGQATTSMISFGQACDHFNNMLKAKSNVEFGSELFDFTTRLGLGSLLSIGAISGVYNIYRDYMNAVEKRTKMNGLNKLIQIAREFEVICIQHGLESQFKISDIQDSKTLILMDKLEHPRYKDDSLADKRFNIIEVHTLAYDIYVNDKLLAPILGCVAEMDAYNAFATNLVNSYDRPLKFCFVNYIEGERAEINARKFWSMLLERPVANTLCESRNVLLTGPNAGGKSTTIRAIMQNILLGQCFGVAAAESFDFTMFDVIHSYLSITDNILSGESRFKAEINRAISIYKKIETLDANQKYFFALDELFTGTSVEQGEKCAHAFMKRIAKRKNVQSIYATHFEKLKEMGKMSGSGVVNYKVDTPIKLEDGKLKYPFTISLGASEVNIALDIAQQAGLFDEEMNADAILAAA